ncbi:MAG TPA: ornithine cyclodeaminase family protein [Candidatus Limnocylindria bacterium]|nr:ornithine cyclodeaminase family protein [Candidatus Limnocylindria bacterium]
MLVLSRGEIEELLDPDELRAAVASALADLSAGRASMPTRIAALVPERDALLAAMPAYLPTAGALTTKLVSLFPHNVDRPTHQAIIVAFDDQTGTPAALLDGEAITAARTAAASALATDLLARTGATRLVVVGTGVQARAHLRAVTRVRRFTSIRVVGRDAANAAALAAEMERELGSSVQAERSLEQALRGADVVCACTHSPEPVVRRTWLADGAHVNSVGYNTAGREVDEDTVAEALVVVESRTAALAPPPGGSNDLLWPIRDGRITKDHVHAELGELVAGTRPGRAHHAQLTLYKSVGVAVEDAAATALVLRRARERGVGREIDL